MSVESWKRNAKGYVVQAPVVKQGDLYVRYLPHVLVSPWKIIMEEIPQFAYLIAKLDLIEL